MDPTPKRRTPSADVESAIIDAAIDLLSTHGPEALSVRKIAAAAGVAPMGVYNHFNGKSGVIDAVWRRGFAELAQRMDSVDAIEDPRAALYATGQLYRTFALEHRTAYGLMFMGSVPGFTPSGESVLISLSAFDGLTRAITRCMDHDVIAKGDETLVAQMIWSAVHGAMALELAQFSFAEDPADVFHRLQLVLLEGLAPGTPAN